MKRFIKIICLGLCVASSTNALAINGCLRTVVSNENTTSVYFSNGVGTIRDDANGTRAFLEMEYKQHLESQESNSKYRFKTAYNYTQGYFTDVVQVFQQKLEESGINTMGLTARQIYTLIKGRLSQGRLGTFLQVVNILYKLTIDPRVALAVTILERIVLESIIEEAVKDTLRVNAEHTKFYTDDLAAGKRIIVVAHSQGNLFALSSVENTLKIFPQLVNSIGIIGVASPAATGNDSLNYYSYITAHDDLVIDALRVVEDVLESNLDNDPDPLEDNRDISNHVFLDSYFNGSLESRSRINTEVARLTSDLIYPNRIAGEGAIRVSLTWGNQPDVDLHVFEPNGSHVFYGNRMGQSGVIDVDDLMSFGPENYFVECENIETGIYRIGAQYFRGYQPETVNINLMLGDESSPISRSMFFETADASNINPLILFEVEVTENDDAGVKYTVR